MKKLLLALLLALLCMDATLAEGAALAEEAVDMAFVGNWEVSVESNGTSLHKPYTVYTLTISRDGAITTTLPGLYGPLTTDPQTGGYTCGEYQLTVDKLGTLFLRQIGGLRLYVCQKTSKSYFDMPFTETDILATGGEWQLTHVKYRYEKSYWYSDRPWIGVEQLDAEPLTLRLDPLATESELKQAFKRLIDNNAETNTVAALLKDESVEITSLGAEGVILLEGAQHWYDGYQYEVCLTRIQASTLGEEVAAQARKMAGLWIITDLSVAGFDLPADALAENYVLQIDEYGFVRLGDEQFELAVTRSGLLAATPTLTLKPDFGSQPTFDLRWTKDAIVITDPDSGAQLHFITYAEHFWRSLCGTWRIGSIYLPGLMREETAGMSFTLTLEEDYTAVLTAGGQVKKFTVTPTESITEFTMTNTGHNYCLSYDEYSQAMKVYLPDDTGDSLTLTFARPTAD